MMETFRPSHAGGGLVFASRAGWWIPIPQSRGHRSGEPPRRGRKCDGAMKRRIGDRRARARFEIVGDLWGSLDAKATFTVRNLGSTGALLESPVALAPDSMHWVSAMIDGQAEPLRVLVRYSVQHEGADKPRYLTGVEFVSLTPATQAFIRQQLGQHGAGPGGV